MNPVFYYGNDVFDSTSYIYGFLVNKTNLAISWIIVYPLVGFVTIVLSGAFFLILRDLTKRNALKVELLHPDQCFGFSRLGALNITLLIPYFLTYEVMFFLSITHESNYLSLIIPLVFTTVLFLVASFLIMFPLLKFLWQQNDVLVSNIEESLEGFRENNKNPSLKFSINVLLFTNSSRSPYSKSSGVAIIALRVIPIGMTVYKALTYQTHI